MTPGTVLDEKLALAPADSRGSIDLFFEVEEPAGCLIIDFSYEPKFHDPGGGETRIANLVTISLDRGAEYLGCAHRHPHSQRHVVSPAGSSPGFHASPIVPGRYRIAVSAHCVATPTCEVRIRATLGGSPPGAGPGGEWQEARW